MVFVAFTFLNSFLWRVRNERLFFQVVLSTELVFPLSVHLYFEVLHLGG